MPFTMSTEFHTEWARKWAKIRKDFVKTSGETKWRNLRPNVYIAQHEFEKHISKLMNYGNHQPLY